MNNFLLSILFGLVAMLSWGTGDFLAAISSRKIGSLKTYFWMRIAGTILASLYLFQTKEKFPLELNLIFPLFLSALLEVIATLSFYKGLSIGLLSVVSPISSSWAMVTAILAVIFLKEVFSIVELLAIGLIILGIWLVSSDLKLSLSKKINLKKGGKEGLIAMFGWGLMAFLFIFASKNYGGWYLSIMIMRVFTILLVSLFSAFFKKNLVIKKKNFSILKLILPIGLFDALGFFSLNFGSLIGQASIVSPISSSFSVITVILGIVFLKEKLITSQIFGILSVIAGIVILSI